MKTLTMLVGAAATLAVGAVAAVAVLRAGLYDISATDPHLSPTHWLLDRGMRRSVEWRGKDIEVPPLDDERLIARGLGHFRMHCVQCHGAPGVAPQPFALGMLPVPVNLAYAAREWSAGEQYWIIRNGIKMTGMPAFEYRLDDDDIWSLVAFMRRLPMLSPRDYAAMRPIEPAEQDAPPIAGPADPARGKRAIAQYACIACHQIPGVVGANAPVGPPLGGIARRAMLGGLLPNTPENLVRWIRNPQQIHPASAMPDLGVGERDARDMAAYLATLD